MKRDTLPETLKSEGHVLPVLPVPYVHVLVTQTHLHCIKTTFSESDLMVCFSFSDKGCKCMDPDFPDAWAFHCQASITMGAVQSLENRYFQRNSFNNS